MFAVLYVAKAAEGAQRFWSSVREPETGRETASAKSNHDSGLVYSDFFKADKYTHIHYSAGLNISENSRYHLVARFYFALVSYLSSFVYSLEKSIYQEYRSPM